MIARSAEMALRRLEHATTDEEAAEPRAWLERHLVGLRAHKLHEDAEELEARMKRAEAGRAQ